MSAVLGYGTKFSDYAVLAGRLSSLQQAGRFRGGDMSLGSIVALLFSGRSSDVELSDTSIKTIIGLSGYPSFIDELRRPAGDNRYYLTHDVRSDLLREIFSDWMMRPGAYHHYQGVLISLNYDIRGAVRSAAFAIGQEDTAPHVKQYALQVIAEYGGPDNRAAVNKLLEDNTFCGGTQRVNDKQYRTQIRDVALVCLLAIEKLNPQEHGFPRFAIRSRIVQLSSIGFENDEEREKAHAMWRKYRDENK